MKKWLSYSCTSGSGKCEPKKEVVRYKTLTWYFDINYNVLFKWNCDHSDSRWEKVAFNFLSGIIFRFTSAYHLILHCSYCDLSSTLRLGCSTFCFVFLPAGIIMLSPSESHRDECVVLIWTRWSWSLSVFSLSSSTIFFTASPDGGFGLTVYVCMG